MTLDEAATELRAFAEANPYSPQGKLNITDARYERLVEYGGYAVLVRLARITFSGGTRSMWQLEIEQQTPNGRNVGSNVLWDIKQRLLSTATEISGLEDTTKRYVLAT